MQEHKGSAVTVLSGVVCTLYVLGQGEAATAHNSHHRQLILLHIVLTSVIVTENTRCLSAKADNEMHDVQKEGVHACPL